MTFSGLFTNSTILESDLEEKSYMNERDIKNKITKINTENTAQAFLELLSMRGVDCFFGNAGTDFTGIVDGFARRVKEGKKRPKPVAVTHEIPLIGMAHGYYLITGRPQAAMVHVGVGTANAIGMVMSAQRARVPMLLCAGRTPVTEEGHPASRSSFIHWAQESFDQAGILREYVKWDYELKEPSQLEDVVDRALLMAMSDPAGPVYLTLPRELLHSPFERGAFSAALRFDLPTCYPDPAKIHEAAKLVSKAERPLVITSSAGRDPECVKELTNLCEEWNIGVVSFCPEYMNFPADHHCHQGFSPDPLLKDADLILVIDCDVPWFPAFKKPQESTRIINIGIDPFYSRYPVRSFRSDLTINGNTLMSIKNLREALSGHLVDRKADIIAGREALRKQHDDLFRGYSEKRIESSSDIPIDSGYLSSRVNSILGNNTINVNEYDNQMIEQTNHRPGAYFGIPHAGYLGWGFGASLGVKMAAPEKTVITTIGDGSYIFSVPSACHFASASYNLPVLVIIYNNQGWNAVRQATLALHPEGWIKGMKNIPMVDLNPSPDFEKICEAFGGYGEKVESPDQIDGALERAMHAVQKEKRQACLNVICR